MSQPLNSLGLLYILKLHQLWSCLQVALLGPDDQLFSGTTPRGHSWSSTHPACVWNLCTVACPLTVQSAAYWLSSTAVHNWGMVQAGNMGLLLICICQEKFPVWCPFIIWHCLMRNFFGVLNKSQGLHYSRPTARCASFSQVFWNHKGSQFIVWDVCNEPWSTWMCNGLSVRAWV
jgi:hypothetical protein